MRVIAALLGFSLTAAVAEGQEARRRWEQMCQIRQDKFDHILPEAMRENGIDMWIVTMKEGHYDPLYEDLGRGYPGRVAFYIFTDRGGRSYRAGRARRRRRAARGLRRLRFVAGDSTSRSSSPSARPGASASTCRKRSVPPTGCRTRYLELTKTLGEPFASRIVSAEKLVSDFRSRRVASEMVAFARGGRPVAADRGAGAVERSDHARRDDARGRRLVDAGPAPGTRARLVVRHALASTSPGRPASRTSRTRGSSSAGTCSSSTGASAS